MCPVAVETDREAFVEPQTCCGFCIDRLRIEDVERRLIVVRIVDEIEDESIIFGRVFFTRHENGLTDPLSINRVAVDRWATLAIVFRDATEKTVRVCFGRCGRGVAPAVLVSDEAVIDSRKFCRLITQLEASLSKTIRI